MPASCSIWRSSTSASSPRPTGSSQRGDSGRAGVADVEQADVEVRTIPAHLQVTVPRRPPAFDGPTGQGRYAVIDHPECQILATHRRSGTSQAVECPSAGAFMDEVLVDMDQTAAVAVILDDM